MKPDSSELRLERAVEALLFWKGEPMTTKALAKACSASEEEVKASLGNLKESLAGRGIVLMKAGDGDSAEYCLGTSPEASELIETITKEELSKDLGKASLETLSIILYKGPVKRSDIDYIRGVNSTFILRNLLIRGLIEKMPAPHDNRASIYGASAELLSYLGVASIEELPNFEIVKEEIEKFRAGQEEADAAAAAMTIPAEAEDNNPQS